ncbi:MAG: ABC transporter permease [Candidatus Schekmanbacteria bacterium]|nr:MAG: ABC transporter permease [Candidatus Schekmanbacteria bacterium]
MWNRIFTVIKKELKQIRRSPELIRILLIAPIMQLIVFGYAATLDICKVKTVVTDRDNTKLSRQYRRKLFSNIYFIRAADFEKKDDKDIYLDKGLAKVSVEIPKNFAFDIHRNRTASIQMLIDGVDSNYARIVESYASEITRNFSSLILKSKIRKSELLSENILYSHLKDTKGQLIDVKEEVLFNPELESKNFMIPAILVMILLVTTMLLSSVAVVKEKELQTFEQIVATPLSAFELLAGKLLPFVLIGIFEASLILTVSLFWFNVPLRGSIFLLYLLTFLFLFTTLGFGTLISVFSNSQHQAMMTSFLIMMPSVILSGMIFPISNMPKWIQLITYIIPARYFVEIARGIMLKGANASDLSFQIEALAILGLFIFTTAVFLFGREVK